MIPLIIFFITISVISISLFLLNKSGGIRILFFSPIGMSIFYILVKLLPGFYISSDYGYSYNSFLSLLIFVFGIFLASLASFAFYPYWSGRFYVSKISFNKLEAYSIIFLSFLSFIFVYVMFGNAPLVYLLDNLINNDYSLTMQQARMNNTLQHVGDGTVYFGQGYFKFLYLTLAPLFISSAYIYNKLYDGDASRLIKFTMVAFILMAAFNGQVKPPIMIFLFFALTVQCYPYFFSSIKKNNERLALRLILKFTLIYTALILLVIGLRYLQSISGRYIDDVLSNSLDRIFYLPANILFEQFPYQYPFKLGATWLNDISGLLPGSVQAFNYEVYTLVYGTTGGFTLSPGLILSAYINFGLIGVFITSLVLYTLYQVMFFWLSSSNHIEFRVLSFSVSLSLALALSSDIVSAIMPIVITFLIFFIVKFMRINLFFNY